MNIERLRTSVAAAMGGALLVAGLLVGASFALAQETTEPEVTTESETPRGTRGHRGDARHFGGHLEDIAEEFGTTLDELKSQLADGATLDEIATDLGIDLEGVLDGLRQKALDAIDQQVADGNLTQERADEIKERIESFDLEDGPRFGARGFGGDDHRSGDRRGAKGFLEGLDLDIDLEELRGLLDSGASLEDALAELGIELDLEGLNLRGLGRHLGDSFDFFGDLDIDLEELRELLSSGMSIEDALVELGVDVDALIADAQEAALAHLDERVAAGTVTQERADEIREKIESFDLSEGFPFGMKGFDFGRRGAGGGFPHHLGKGFFGDGASDTNAEGAVFDA
ncbi:MAG: hypothetical protein GY926_02760 [bacterium]|nr:hypothetical protein [bacterium]